MTKIRRLAELMDEKSEVAAALVLLLAIVGRATERLDQWPAVSLVAMALLTFLGAQYFRGVSVGPSGVEVRGE